MENIQTHILATLSATSSSKYTVIFSSDWSPLAFVKEQEFSTNPNIALECAVTYTGSANNAQALTTAQYLTQTWQDAGINMMKLLKDVVWPAETSHASLPSSADTNIRMQIVEDRFIVTVTGTSDFIIKTGQQIAWLGAALRSPTSQTEPAICLPSIASQSSIGMCFGITFNMHLLKGGEKAVRGQGWLKMVRNPTIVSGYPISHKGNLGLEIPLDILAALVDSSEVTDFHGTAYIKGYSTMVVAVEKTETIVIWRYKYKELDTSGDFQRISYNDAGDITEKVPMSGLNLARHVVG